MSTAPKTKKMRYLLLPVETLDKGIFEASFFQNMTTPQQIADFANAHYRLMMKMGADNIKDIENMRKMGIELDIENPVVPKKNPLDN